MEGHKHFSHTHILNHHQVPQGTTITCSGCKSSATGTVYVCLPCNFYLHENCYRATRSLKHPSHPSHPLTLVPYPTYPSNSFYCNTCTLVGTGFSYSCSNCEFDIHVQCAYSNSSHQSLSPPNQTPSFVHHQSMTNQFQTPDASTHAYMPHQPVTHPTGLYNMRAPHSSHSSNQEYETRGQILHKSHPSHPLTLLPTPPYASNAFTCNACNKDGSVSTYHCATCQFDLHVKCASLTEIVKREDHQHPLQLIYSCPSQAKDYQFTCDVCHSVVPNHCWLYYCKQCDFGCHTECVNSEACDVEDLADQLAAAQIASKIAAYGRQAALELLDPPGTTYKYSYYDNI